ncbi:hypothetical protein ENBRE01_2374 [Enteropsectra breve]|nr:hypothetical protein ENBRE01_1454 [Enteropsectra breve]KAI5151773.1 hypothetical protein ENBRE01_2374 [Enteropsectra breve]
MESNRTGPFEAGKMVFFHTLTSVAPLAFFLTPLVAESLGSVSAGLLCFAGCGVSAFYQYFRIRHIAIDNDTSLPQPYSALPGQNEVIKENLGKRFLKAAREYFKYFNSIAVPLFYCYIGCVYLQQFLALLPLTKFVFTMSTTIIAAICGTLLFFCRRYPNINKYFYVIVTVLMALGFIFINLVNLFYYFPEIHETFPNDALYLSPSAAVFACVFMFSSVKIPRSFLGTSSFMPQIYKVVSVVAGYAVGLVYIASVQDISIILLRQFFVSAANHILDPSMYFANDGGSLFSTGVHFGPLTLGLIALCPVIMMLNENIKKVKATNEPNSANNAETVNANQNKFTKHYSIFLIVIALLCPFLVGFSTLTSIFFKLLIATRFIESFVLYPLSVIVSSNTNYSQSFKRIPMVLMASSWTIFLYSVYEYIMNFTGFSFIDNSVIMNNTTTVATTIA